MKLTQYPKLFSAPATWTVLDELIPVSIELALRGTVGIFNWTNPGQMTHNELMLLYKKYVDPGACWELATEQEMCNARVNAPLSMDKLFGVYPEARATVLPVAQAVEAMMKRAGEAKAAAAAEQ
eukprot:TRINITY_DN1946_c0_g1_i2.p7 TRINITY_DN1946_c0_g1~~TRINITY_DN1946_c0_g1_i2.p7  ORF type:complete len:124 (+),score=40.42 TRINITY_DN1946_c0_g1_i2:1397-1768(+)